MFLFVPLRRQFFYYVVLHFNKTDIIKKVRRFLGSDLINYNSTFVRINPSHNANISEGNLTIKFLCMINARK